MSPYARRGCSVCKLCSGSPALPLVCKFACVITCGLHAQGWAPGGQQNLFPPETGITIGPNGFKYFTLQIHCEEALTCAHTHARRHTCTVYARSSLHLKCEQKECLSNACEKGRCQFEDTCVAYLVWTADNNPTATPGIIDQ